MLRTSRSALDWLNGAGQALLDGYKEHVAENAIDPKIAAQTLAVWGLKTTMNQAGCFGINGHEQVLYAQGLLQEYRREVQGAN